MYVYLIFLIQMREHQYIFGLVPHDLPHIPTCILTSLVCRHFSPELVHLPFSRFPGRMPPPPPPESVSTTNMLETIVQPTFQFHRNHQWPVSSIITTIVTKCLFVNKPALAWLDFNLTWIGREKFVNKQVVNSIKSRSLQPTSSLTPFLTSLIRPFRHN